jgi:hypothetical protein
MRSTPRPTARPSQQRITKAVVLAAPMLALALTGAFMTGATTSAMAQNVHQYAPPGSSGPSSYGTSTGGTVQRGTAVPTGQGPLNQAIPPAASSYYSRQLGHGTTPTNPSANPFGTQ